MHKLDSLIQFSILYLIENVIDLMCSNVYILNCGTKLDANL